MNPEKLMKMILSGAKAVANLPPEIQKSLPRFRADGTIDCKTAPTPFICKVCFDNACRVATLLGAEFQKQDEAEEINAMKMAADRLEELGRAHTTLQTEHQKAKHDIEHARNAEAFAKDDLEKAREQLGYGPDGEYDVWLDDQVQLARLICELDGVYGFTVDESVKFTLRTSMDIEEASDLEDLFKRADRIWDRAKVQLGLVAREDS